MKLGVRLDQPLYRSACVRFGQAKGYLANDLVTLIAPGPSIAADWEKKYRQRQEDVACFIAYSKIHLLPRLELEISAASARRDRDKGTNY
jgi:hypothetical protein